MDTNVRPLEPETLLNDVRDSDWYISHAGAEHVQQFIIGKSSQCYVMQ